MSLIKKTAKLISDIAETLKTRKYNERKVERLILEPLLESLGWAPEDYEYQYSVGDGKVDYALFHTGWNNRHLRAFIEVKAPGMIKPESEKQLFEYALYESPPILILTDGSEWNFYLTGLQGKFQDKKFCQLIFSAQSPEESAGVLHKCLHKDAITSEQAINTAKEMREAKDVAKAWELLLHNRNEKLSKLLKESFHENFGYTPKEQSIAKFLGGMSPAAAPVSGNLSVKFPAAQKPKKVSAKNPSPKPSGIPPIQGFSYKGKEYPMNSARKTLSDAIAVLGKYNKEFLPALQNREPKLISRDKEKLAEVSPWLNKYGGSVRDIEVRGETWHVVVNHAPPQIARILEKCCQIAGVSFGEDFRILHG